MDLDYFMKFKKKKGTQKCVVSFFKRNNDDDFKSFYKVPTRALR